MKIVLFAAILTLILGCSHQPKEVIQRNVSSVEKDFILAIGDSNLNGPHGDTLHNELVRWNKADVMSIAIGGASVNTFVGKMTSTCCGYTVRFSQKGSSWKEFERVKNQVREDHTTYPVLSRAPYNQDLFAVIKHHRPKMIIISLGSNKDPLGLSSYKTLLARIHAFNPDIPVLWIGPPHVPENPVGVERADKFIQDAINDYPQSPYRFFSSAKYKVPHPGVGPSQKWLDGFKSDMWQLFEYGH
jgi:hypothetical protein